MYPIPGGIRGQDGCGLGQPSLVGGVPTHSRGLEQDGLSLPFPANLNDGQNLVFPSVNFTDSTLFDTITKIICALFTVLVVRACFSFHDEHHDDLDQISIFFLMSSQVSLRLRNSTPLDASFALFLPQWFLFHKRNHFLRLVP